MAGARPQTMTGQTRGQITMKGQFFYGEGPVFHIKEMLTLYYRNCKSGGRGGLAGYCGCYVMQYTPFMNRCGEEWRKWLVIGCSLVY